MNGGTLCLRTSDWGATLREVCGRELQAKLILTCLDTCPDFHSFNPFKVEQKAVPEY